MNLHRAPVLVRSMANIFQRAIDALRLARETYLSSMPDDLVREQYPFRLRDYFHQILFDLRRIGLLGELQPPRDPGHVRVDYDAHTLLEPRSQHYVRSFARDSR